jgi:adenylate cyclase
MESGGKEQRIYEFGDFRLIPGEGLLLHNGEPIALQPKAFAVLALLVERNGHLVAKSEIIDKVWEGAFVEEAAISKSIWFVRNALGDASKEKFIQTVPRRGYRFVAPVKVLNDPAAAAAAAKPEFVSTGYRLPLILDDDVLDLKADKIDDEAVVQHRKYNSIAVLSFVSQSPNPEDEYFCDGLAEELLNALAKISGLKVAARTSSFSFKGKNVSVRQIGKLLNVHTVLEGSVRRSEDRLRIMVQLIDAETGYHIWSERFDRHIEDIFDVQDEITLAIVDTLKVALKGDVREAALKRYTDDHEAYDLYLKGLYHCYKWTDEGLRKSIEYFEKALEKDPEFAPAHAKIADYYHFSSHIGLFSPNDILPKWKAAAQRALEIDEGLADAHLAMAHIYFYYERDWTKAEREFEQAVKLNPNSTYAHKHYGLFLASRERFDEAVAEGKKALDLDPLSIAVSIVVGFIYLFVDRLDDTRRVVRRMTELDPNAPQAYWLGGSLLMASGDYAEAIDAFEKALSLGDNQMALSKLGCAYGLAGRREEALKILDQLFEMRERQYADPFNIARVYAALCDNDNTFRWMEKALEEHSADLVFLKRSVEAGAGVYMGNNFSTDPRYMDILRRAGLAKDRIAVGHRPGATKKANTTSSTEYIVNRDKHDKRVALLAFSPLVIAVALFFFFNRPSNEIRSVAVMPFVNETGDPQVEYLSDGMTDTLISSLSELPNIKVKARTSVFRYKGKEIDPKVVGKELGVQTIVNGRIAQRDGRTSVSLEVVDTETENVIFSTKYDKSQLELITLQSEIARDVPGSSKANSPESRKPRSQKPIRPTPRPFSFIFKASSIGTKADAAMCCAPRTISIKPLKKTPSTHSHMPVWR